MRFDPDGMDWLDNALKVTHSALTTYNPGYQLAAAVGDVIGAGIGLVTRGPVPMQSNLGKAAEDTQGMYIRDRVGVMAVQAAKIPGDVAMMEMEGHVVNAVVGKATGALTRTQPGSPAVEVPEVGTGGGKSSGRGGAQARLKEIAADPKTSRADRGWIKQETNAIARGKRTSIRRPPGKELAHARGREAAKGYSHTESPSSLQDKDLHRTQHRYDDYGRKNKERP